MLILAGILTITFGLAIYIPGKWPRRIGTLPHCKRCRHCLFGTDSQRCAECGTLLDEKGIVYGVRPINQTQIQVGFIAIVLALLLIGVSTYQRLRNVDWYQFRSDSGVASDTLSSDRASVSRAWDVINHRQRNGDWSTDASRPLFARALAELQKPRPLQSAEALQLLEHLAAGFKAGVLTPEESQQFLSSICKVELIVRPVVAAGDPVVFEICYRNSILETAGLVVRGDMRLQVGPRIVETLSAEREMVFTSQIPDIAIGKHKLHVHQSAVLSRQGDSSHTALHTFDRSFEQPFEVVSKSIEELVTLQKYPEWEERIRSSIQIGDPEQRTGQIFFLGAVPVFINASPIDLALSVSVREGGVERPIGTVYARNGRRLVTFLYHRFEGDLVDLIFRGSREAASLSLDCYTTWDGEVVIANVPVRRNRSKVNEKATTLPTKAD